MYLKRPVISVTMTDYDIMERVGRLLDRAVCPIRKADGCKQAWQVRIAGYEASQWMRRLHPLLGERRRRQIDTALTGYEGRPRRLRCGTVYGYRKGCRCDACRTAKHDEYVRLKAA